MILEEFANSGYIPDFEQIITVSRKRNISISLVVQEIEQIERLYRGQLETIISGGCQNKLFYSGLGVKTSEYVSRMLGDKTIEVTSTHNPGTFSGKDTTTTSSSAARRLMTPDEVRRLDKDSALFVSGNHAPILTSVLPLYKNKELQQEIAQYQDLQAEIKLSEKKESVLIEQVNTAIRE